MKQEDRVFIAFIEIDRRPVLRISIKGKSMDYPLNKYQIKHLLRETAIWVARDEG
jgi:hypothetical protein